MSDIRRQLLSDLKLLNRRINWIIGGVFLIVSAMMVWITRRAAGGLLEVIHSGLLTSGINPQGTNCDIYAGLDHISGCLANIPQTTDRVFTESMIEYYPAVVEASALSGTPSGLLTFAARHGGTMLGLLVLVLIVALHTTAPWESGTARWLIPRIGLRRFLFEKFFAQVVVAFAIPLLGWAGAALGLAISTGQTLPPGAAPSWGSALTQLAQSWFVLLLVGTLAVGIAAWARSLVIAFVVTCGVIALFFFGAMDRELYRYSPAGWIAAIQQLPYGDYRQTVDYLWAAGTPGEVTWLPVLCMIVIALIPLTGAYLRLQRARPLA